MATDSEKAELTRLAGTGTPLVQVTEFPKLAEVLGPFIPRAAIALRDWDEKVEVWRRSILAQRSATDSLPVPPP
jgi:hypothetical protein